MELVQIFLIFKITITITTNGNILAVLQFFPSWIRIQEEKSMRINAGQDRISIHSLAKIIEILIHSFFIK